MNPFGEFLRRIAANGLECYGIFYGTYRGVVMSNEDPENLGRIKVHVPQVHGEDYPDVWAWPKAIGAGDMCGLWFIPDIGMTVHVTFDHGRPEHPFWEGGWWGSNETHPDMTPKKVVLVVPEGMKVVLDREANTILLEQAVGNSVFISNSEMKIRHTGPIKVDGDDVTVVAMGTATLRSMGTCLVEALDEVSIVATGAVKLDGAESVDIGSTAAVHVHSAGLVDILSDTAVNLTSTKNINMTAPAIQLNGNVTVTGNYTQAGTFSLTGSGSVTGNWTTAGTNSAHHTHPVSTTGGPTAQTGIAAVGA